MTSQLYLSWLNQSFINLNSTLTIYFDNWDDQFFKEGQSQKWWPVVVQEVDEQAFDVRTVLILICHDHQATIAQRLEILYGLALFVVLQTKDLDQAVDLSILHFFVGSFHNVQNFSIQGEDSELVAANNTKTKDSKGFGRISFIQNQSMAFNGIFPSCVVIVLQCRNAS